MNKWLNNIQHRWPMGCLLCGETTAAEALCLACRDDLPRLRNACTVCAMPLSAGNGPCGRCQQHPPPFSHTFSLFHYAPPVDFLLQRMKFGNKLAVAHLMGRLMAAQLKHRTAPLPERLIPVPLHARRLRQRGYNQSLELARPVAADLGLALDVHACHRILHTEAQSDLPAKERRRNISGAFATAADFHATRVAIVDDIMTTGSTVTELAHALRKAGAKTIEVWVCARATP